VTDRLGPAAPEGLVPAAPGLWLHRDVAPWSSGIPEGAPVDDVSSGRGSLRRVRCGGMVALVRRYRRGGALRRLLPDAFLSDARARREVAALARLAPLGLAPRCLALEVRGGWLKRLTIAVEEVPGARDLLAHAQDGERDERGLAAAAGRAVRAMHDAGVLHADLNLTNVIARRDASGWRAWIVDLDGARSAPAGPERRVREVLRLCRSVDKWPASARTSAEARAAFLREALPAPLRLPALRRARGATRRRGDGIDRD
jgi:3-deoxy-D-manno-octulosonic acid kinase